MPKPKIPTRALIARDHFDVLLGATAALALELAVRDPDWLPEAESDLERGMRLMMAQIERVFIDLHGEAAATAALEVDIQQAFARLGRICIRLTKSRHPAHCLTHNAPLSP